MAGKSLKIFIIPALFLFLQSAADSFAQETFPFRGKISGDNINVRSDSTVSSEIICTVGRGEPVEVVSALYDWYKIKLPKTAPSFIKKGLVEPVDEKTVKVTGDIVNIRLKPDESSPILGKIKENEIVRVLGEKGGWFRIEPANNSFGWVHKNFVKKAPKKEIALPAVTEGEVITVEGKIKPKVITGLASHKLIARDKKVFLLRGNKAILNAFNSREARIIGKIVPADIKESDPIIEIIKMEALD